MRKKPRNPSETPFNLLPVMNVMFLLIPAMLLSMETIDARAINVEPPKFCACNNPDDVDPPPLQEPLALKIRVLEDGYDLSYRGAEPSTGAPDLPRVEGKLDTAGLKSIAVELKDAYPHEVVVDVTAEATVPYGEVVETLDTLRGEECDNPDLSSEGCLFPRPFVSA